MKQKNLNLIAVLLLVTGLTGLQAQGKLYVKEKSGTQTSYAFNSIRKLTFSSGNMIVTKTDDNTSSYGLSDIRYLSFRDIITDVKPVGIDEISITSLYPNPVIDQLNISYESPDAKNVQIEIIDVQGRVLLNQTISSQNGTNLAKITVANLAGGLYICRLLNGSNPETIKFLKN
jgi:hypothetical protein